MGVVCPRRRGSFTFLIRSSVFWWVWVDRFIVRPVRCEVAVDRSVC